jgi:predicted O-methyltransferase YrrM
MVIQSDIPGHLSPGEGTYLHNLASRLVSGQRVVEIGAYMGRSTSYIASALRPGVEFYSIDIWLPDLPAESAPPITNKETFDVFQMNIVRWNDKIQVLRGYSAEIGSVWDKGAIDLCFIDADHSYEGVKKDIVTWLSHMRKGGRMCFHDYAQPTSGVRSAVDHNFIPLATDLQLIGSILSGIVSL